jgi:hypothetical protein
MKIHNCELCPLRQMRHWPTRSIGFCTFTEREVMDTLPEWCPLSNTGVDLQGLRVFELYVRCEHEGCGERVWFEGVGDLVKQIDRAVGYLTGSGWQRYQQGWLCPQHTYKLKPSERIIE